MCILGQLIDVENFKAICKKKKEKIPSYFPVEDCLCIYLVACVFKDPSSFVVLCNMEAFVHEEGPHAE